MLKRKITLAVVSAILGFSAISASAMATKNDSPYDHRIKTVAYNPLDTVQLDCVVGTGITIRLAPGEEYVSHWLGDDKAFILSHKMNFVFIRPVVSDADTNLTIITSQREYNILLHYIGDEPVKGPDGKMTKGFIKTPWALKQSTVALQYTYPEEDAARARAKFEKERAKEDLKKALAQGAKEGDRNIDYTMSVEAGTEGIRPVNVWDDFRFTSFKFPANAMLPQVFFINADGQESRPNFHVEGPEHNIVVAENVAKEWIIRSGEKVVGVLNWQFDPSKGSNASGTTAEGVHRVIKGNVGDDE
jgi:type IV secretion system protein VirB9